MEFVREQTRLRRHRIHALPGTPVVVVDVLVHLGALLLAHLLGEASKAHRELDWKPTVTFRQLVRIMVNADIQKLQDLKGCKDVIQQIMNKSSKPQDGYMKYSSRYKERISNHGYRVTP